MAKTGEKKIVQIKLALSLAAAGFFPSLLTIVDRFHPFPADVHPLETPESFMGAATLVLILILKKNLQWLSRLNVEKTTQSFGPIWQFFLVFSFYTVLWSTMTHELMALFNSMDIDLESEKIRGIRSFATTIWWAALAGWMIFAGIKKPGMENHKNIGFGLFSVTLFKILFIDLYHINTNLKVFVFLSVGGLMLGISYFANKKASPE